MSEAVKDFDSFIPQKLGRQRDRILLIELIKAAGKNGGVLTPEVACEAVNNVYTAKNAVKPKRAMEILRAKMNNPNFREGVGNVFTEFADFGPDEAVKIHVAHIRQGNYAALKDYERMVIGEPSKKVELNIGTVGPSMLQNVPDIAPRAIGPAVVEEVIPHEVQFDEEPGDDNG